jgi:hypothetical protein
VGQSLPAPADQPIVPSHRPPVPVGSPSPTIGPPLDDIQPVENEDDAEPDCLFILPNPASASTESPPSSPDSPERSPEQPEKSLEAPQTSPEQPQAVAPNPPQVHDEEEEEDISARDTPTPLETFEVMSLAQEGAALAGESTDSRDDDGAKPDAPGGKEAVEVVAPQSEEVVPDDPQESPTGLPALPRDGIDECGKQVKESDRENGDETFDTPLGVPADPRGQPVTFTRGRVHYIAVTVGEVLSCNVA